ncbi:hypothetical protein SAMN04489726_7119 [Allokutzneria albata]|uniref:YtxH-like protein n=2 Tax=Allokutzneria albata TaxID=211114 RepID=A0A1H0CAT5_ALLAB|nr:hypothetical protein SAMN04489726_7119 [Allokutzneria albata]
MMKALVLGAAVGYVLGARAGRERYEQINRAYHRVLDHPAVQGAAGFLRAKVSEKTGHRKNNHTAPFEKRDPVLAR